MGTDEWTNLSRLVVEFYVSMLESTLNLDINFTTVKGKVIMVTPELISNILGLLNVGIVLREPRNDAKAHL